MEYLDDDDSIFVDDAGLSSQLGATDGGVNQEGQEEQTEEKREINGIEEERHHDEKPNEQQCFYADDDDLSEYDMYIDDYDSNYDNANPDNFENDYDDEDYNDSQQIKEEEEEEDNNNNKNINSINNESNVSNDYENNNINEPINNNTTKPKFKLQKAMNDWNAIKERFLKSREEKKREEAIIEEARRRTQSSELSRGVYHDPGGAPKPYLLECVLGKENCEIKESIRLANEIWLTPARLDYGLPDDFMPREWIVGMRVRKVCEGTQVEFKQGRTSLLQRVMNDIERYGNAFVNTRGGVLVYGVTDDGIVEGVRLNRHDRDYLNNGLGERISTLTPRIPPECYRLIFVPTKLPPNAPTAQAALLRAGINMDENEKRETDDEEFDEDDCIDEEEDKDSLLLSDKESYVIIFVMGYHKTLSSRYILFKNNIAVALQRANSSTQFVSIRMISYAPSSNSAVPGSKEYSEVQNEEAEALRRVQTEADEHEAIMVKRRAVLAFRETLSAYQERDKIGAAISENRITIIAGPTGCGKSTQVPQIISDAYDQLRPVKILVVQPRRISAVALARRVAEEMGVKIGEEVGYHIGGRPQCDDSTRILFITYGMFKQYLDNRDLISPFTHIVLDEIHERKLDMDICLAMALSYASKRPRTRIIVMSATIDVGDFARYCGGFARMQNTIIGTHKDLDLSREYVYSGSPWLAKTVRLTGRKFPIQTFYLDDILPSECLAVVEKSFSADKPYFNDVMKRTIIAVIEAIASKILASPGAALSRLAILVFLPGISAIVNVYDSLSFSPISHILSICTMHSTCSIDEQRMLLRSPEPGRVKVVLCTNIAESSLTIPDAAAIIDTCLCRDMHWDKTARALKLQDDWISRESALQRTGRCGRVQPGEVYRLVPRAFFEKVLPAKCIPEIKRVPLEECILRTIRGPFKDVEEILSRCIDPPDAEDVRAALQNLVDLGLIQRRPDPDTLGKIIATELTPLGRITAELPVPWQMGMFLVLAKTFGLLEDAIVYAAALSIGSPFKRSAVLPVIEHEALVRFSGGFRCDATARANAYFYWASEREKLNLGGLAGVSMAANSLNPNLDSIAAAEFRWCEMNSLDLRQLREIDNLVFALRGKLSSFGLCPQPRKSEVAKRVFYRRELIQNEHLGISVPDSAGSIERGGRKDGGQASLYLSHIRKFHENGWKKPQKDYLDVKKEYMKTPGQTSVVLSHIEFSLKLPESSFIKTHTAEEIAEIKKQYITLTDDDYENLQGIEAYESGLDCGCNGNVCDDNCDNEKPPTEERNQEKKKKPKKKKKKSKKKKQLTEFDIDDDNNIVEDEEREKRDAEKKEDIVGNDFWKQLAFNTEESKDTVLVMQSLLAAVYPQNIFKVVTKAVAKPIWDMWVNVPDIWNPHNIVELNASKFWNDQGSFYFRNFLANGLQATGTFTDLASTSKDPPFFLNLEKDSVRPFAGKDVIESKKLIPESAFSEGVVRIHKIGNKNFDMNSLDGFVMPEHASVATLKAAYSQQQRLEQEEKQRRQEELQDKYHAFGQTFYVPLINAGNGEVDVDAGLYREEDEDGENQDEEGAGGLSLATMVRLYVNPSMNAGARFVYQSGTLQLFISNMSLAFPLSPPPLNEDLLELVRLKASPRRGCLFRAPRRVGISTDIFYQQSEKTGHIACSARSVSMFPDDALSVVEAIPLVFLRNASYINGHLKASYLGCSISQYASIPREYINNVEKVRRWIEVSYQELFRDAAYWPLKHSVGDDTSLKFTREEARLYSTAYRSEKAARKGLLKLIRSDDIVLSTLNSDDYIALKAYTMAAANMKKNEKGQGGEGIKTGTFAMEFASSSLTSNNNTEYFTKLEVSDGNAESVYDSEDYNPNYVDDC